MYNARINWKPGMELTAQTFLDLDANLDFRQQTAIRAALGNHCMGLVPGTPFSCQGTFYTNKFEIDQFEATALLPSGRILHADEPVSITVPLLYGNVYYLTVGFGTGVTSFEKEGVPYIRPRYDYAIQTLEEVMASDVLPITRFKVGGGVFAVDKEFIPPCLLLSTHGVFSAYRQRYVELLQKLSEHPNLREGDGKRTMMRYLFQMKSQDMEGRVSSFISFTQEIAQAIEYFIMAPNREETMEIPQPRQADVAEWLKWLEGYMAGAVSVLDGVVLEDDSIDYEALLAQAKKELYEQLNPELYMKLLAQLKEELRQELKQKLTAQLTAYIEETLKPDLECALGDDLYGKLNGCLYTDLYDALYNALYVPGPEETEFMPII